MGNEPTYTIQITPFEGGLLMSLIEQAPERSKPALGDIRRQLIVMKMDIEKAVGVTKKILPSGMMEIRDADGNRIIRPPYSWEIEGN